MLNHEQYNDDRNHAILARRAELQHSRALTAHPSCMDPDHPGCDRCNGAEDDMADYVARDAHHLDDSLGEFPDMTRELMEGIVAQVEAAESSDPNAMQEAAYGTVEVARKMAAAYAKQLTEQEIEGDKS